MHPESVAIPEIVNADEIGGVHSKSTTPVYDTFFIAPTRSGPILHLDRATLQRARWSTHPFTANIFRARVNSFRNSTKTPVYAVVVSHELGSSQYWGRAGERRPGLGYQDLYISTLLLSTLLRSLQGTPSPHRTSESSWRARADSRGMQHSTHSSWRAPRHKV